MKILIRERRNIVSVDSDAFKTLLDLVLKIEQHLFKTSQEKITDLFMDNFDAGKFLRVGYRTLKRLRDEGLLPFSKHRGKIYFKPEDLVRLIESNFVNPGKKS